MHFRKMPSLRLSVRAQDEKVLEGAEEAKQRMDDERDALRARLAALRRKSALHVLLAEGRVLGSEDRDRAANFTGLVLGCIKAKFCK